MRALILMLVVLTGCKGDGRVDAKTARAIRDYARLHCLRHTLFYTCDNPPARARLSSSLFEVGVSTAFVHLVDGRASKQRLFTRGQRSLAVVDTACERALERASLSGTFEYTTHWLLLVPPGPRALALALAGARAAPLTLNSEVRLLHQITNETWYAYDLYSIEYKKNTPLNITFYGYFTDEDHAIANISNVEEFVYPAPLVLSRNESFDSNEVEERLLGLQTSVARALEGVGRGHGWRVTLERTGSPYARRRRWGHAVALRGEYVPVSPGLEQLNQKPAHVSDRVYLRARTQLHRDAPPRYYLHVLRFLQDLHQFELTLERAAIWGGLQNGSWIGVAGALVAGRADVSAAPMLLKAQRFPAVEYSGLVAYTKLPTLFRQPEAADAPTLAVFTTPLAGSAWAAAIPTCALVVLVLAVAAHLETNMIGNADNYKMNFGEMLLDFVNIFYLDASFRENRLWGGRAAALVACSLGLLLMQFYGASLLAAVLAPPRAPIQSLADLMRSDLQYKVEDVSYQKQFYVDNMEQRDIAQLYNEKIMRSRDAPFIGYDEGLRRVLTESLAFQCTATYTYPVMESWTDEQVCAVDELLVVPRVEHHSAVARGSPYRQPVSVMLVLIRERGVMARVQPEYYKPRPRCPPEHAEAPRPVGRQFYPALYLLAALGGLAVLIFLLELATARLLRSKLHNKTTLSACPLLH